MRPSAGESSFRLDIQYLRAIAVGVVVIYHVWPWSLSGGYVGVDVFFAISGFLITAHLIGEAERSGRIDVRQFWARRIRRLLPAAFVVLMATMVMAVTFLPRDQLRTIALEVLASTLYVQNWLLAANSVDYLAAENAPSPVQHFWSLSVEEQFYIVWPVLLVVALAVVAKRSRAVEPARLTLGLAAFVVVASLATSIVTTVTQPEVAYFSTATRAWEFGAGALTASLVHCGILRAPTRRWMAAGVWWMGVALIMCAAVLFNSSTPFPGVAALLPVAGTVLALYGGVHLVSEGSRVSRWARPVEGLGEISYSVYLWHWPLIVVALAIGGRASGELGIRAGLLVVVASIVLAALTLRFVENPVRRGARWRRGLRPSFALMIVGVLVVGGVSGGAVLELDRRATASASEREALIDCLGAADEAASSECSSARGDAVLPALEFRLDDTNGQYGCYMPAGAEFERCTLGDPNGEIRIAVTGDSHAASLLPGLERAAAREGWAIDVMVGNGCQLFASSGCGARDDIERTLLDGEYDLVIAAALRTVMPPAADLTPYWSQLTNQGVSLAIVADVPHLPGEVDRCISISDGTVEALQQCSTPRDIAFDLYPDTTVTAANELGLPIIDFTDVLCSHEGCPAVINGALVYRDSPASHLTSTFSATLADRWVREVSALVAQG